MTRNIFTFYGEKLLASRPNPQAGGPPLVDCSWLFTQYICSYRLYLEAVFPSAFWGRAVLWWQGPNFHGIHSYYTLFIAVLNTLILHTLHCCAKYTHFSSKYTHTIQSSFPTLTTISLSWIASFGIQSLKWNKVLRAPRVTVVLK